MHTRIVNQQDFDYPAKVLSEGGIVLLPTETVFGVAVIYDNKEAIERLYELKQRPADKAFPLAVCCYEEIETVADLNERQIKIVKALLPGPITLVVKVKADLQKYMGSNGTVAIRYSDASYITKLIERLGKPIFLTSANLSGNLPFVSVIQAKQTFGDDIGAYVDGKVLFGKASTILDITGSELRIIREGPLKMAQIQEKIKNI